MAVEYNCILIRFGEIFLKGNNRHYFESLLIKNIKNALSGIDYKFSKTQGRYYVEEFAPEDKDEIISRLTKVFGIHSVSPTVKVKTDLEEMCKVAYEISPTEGTFRVTVKRADKRFPMTSMEIGAKIGGYMLKKTGGRLKVDLFDYDFELFVDLRESGYSYLFYDKIMGAQGLPTGCSGNAMLLLSGGIDSPVAGYVMAKRGLRIFAIHYHSFPYTSELALQKVKDLAKKLTAYCGDIKLAVVPFTEIQYAIHEHCPEEFMITIMRRFMMRIAERVALKNECGAIITGEALGQVASQTMQSIQVTNSVVTLPVFRPLIGSDKAEIIDIANKIDTFDISIRPYEDCCTVFLPKNPVIKPKLQDAIEYENRLDIEALIEKAIENTEYEVISVD
ncbi:MAG: tRNA 4-thiouridine(8) synthase ThiI [Clostridia bacterium]|nr:tRNA 4-thiouridine(8) synthase ThiI [Clostridia bacterium]